MDEKFVLNSLNNLLKKNFDRLSKARCWISLLTNSNALVYRLESFNIRE